MKATATWKPALLVVILLWLGVAALLYADQEPCLFVLLLYISGIGGLVVSTRGLASRSLLRRGFLIGLCGVLLMMSVTLEWWGWGLGASRGWDRAVFLLYGVCAFAGMGSGQLLHMGAAKYGAVTEEERKDGSVLRLLGLILWTIAFLIVSAANIWWATI